MLLQNQISTTFVPISSQNRGDLQGLLYNASNHVVPMLAWHMQTLPNQYACPIRLSIKMHMTIACPPISGSLHRLTIYLLMKGYAKIQTYPKHFIKLPPNLDVN